MWSSCHFTYFGEIWGWGEVYRKALGTSFGAVVNKLV